MWQTSKFQINSNKYVPSYEYSSPDGRSIIILKEGFLNHSRRAFFINTRTKRVTAELFGTFMSDYTRFEIIALKPVEGFKKPVEDLRNFKELFSVYIIV